MSASSSTSRQAHGQESAARGRYAKSEQVQRRIVQAAAEVFAASGFHATTFKEIARRADVSERGLAYHFPTKEALLAAVIRDHFQWRSAVVLSTSGLGAFAAVLSVVEADAKLPAVVGLQTILGGEATSPDHPAHDDYRARYADLRAYLTEAFAAALNEGQATSELEADELAAGLIALLDGLQLQWLYDRDAVRVLKTVDGYLAAVLSREAMTVVRRLRAEYFANSHSGPDSSPYKLQ